MMGARDFEHRRHRFASGRAEYVVFTREWISALEALAAGEDGVTPNNGGIDEVFSKSENHQPSTVTESEVLV